MFDFSESKLQKPDQGQDYTSPAAPAAPQPWGAANGSKVDQLKAALPGITTLKPGDSDEDAEKSLISACLIDDKAFAECADLSPKSFYSSPHQKIYRAMVALFHKNEPIDLTTVASWLKTSGELDAIGGAAYLVEIADSAPMAMNAGAYARIISDCATRREILSRAQRLVDAASKGVDIDALTEHVEGIRKNCLRDALNFPPQGPGSTSFKKNVIACPPSREFILTCNGVGFLPKKTVGVITATGGTGKTFFLFSLGATLAAGGSLGPIKAPRPTKTLIICGEDDQDEINRRMWNITGGNFPELLYGASTVGEVGPLMELDGNRPRRAPGFKWLEETIRLYDGLEVLIIDPKSRFYGLDENNNDHATQWIQCLEYLSKEYNLNILFAHHTSKQDGGKISQNMSRGASAIVDGCRWQAGMVRMDQETADRYGIDNPRGYVALDVPKSNYAADMNGQIYFKRGNSGVLEYVDFKQGRLELLGGTLFDLLVDDPKRYTYSELVATPAGKDICQDIKTNHSNFARSKDMEPVIKWLMDEGLLRKEFTNPGRNAKEVLVPVTGERS
ncbi:replicative DNA helicase [Desulforapulum autotrophicum HRM2]|uniref:Replicative DNA helicase n=1 Tax=Desulforapulum autotrophicum (strain ATCC 43914 / DSM 3382 / VKM B-1955 / HRM2) TaxID=177437 RepID=C0QHJ0_DESAH|nr:AAA family ATPase [Desulforapulum autotrophicum]ACN17849.1 replicative DNA helicase [Desulforapulum autotrophicum HRM2]